MTRSRPPKNASTKPSSPDAGLAVAVEDTVASIADSMCLIRHLGSDAALSPDSRPRGGGSARGASDDGPVDPALDTLSASTSGSARRRPLVGEGAAVDAGGRIDRYVVLSKIGEGGMGEVFSAYDEELDRRVAIKVLRDRFVGDSVRRARMQREAQALARLSHPNVVQIYDVGHVSGQVFVAMEFVKGETLRDYQQRHDAATRDGRRDH